MVGWRWVVPVCQTPGARTIRVAAGRGGRGGAESSTTVDAARGDRLADAAANLAARAGRLIFDLAKAAANRLNPWFGRPIRLPICSTAGVLITPDNLPDDLAALKRIISYGVHHLHEIVGHLISKMLIWDRTDRIGRRGRSSRSYIRHQVSGLVLLKYPANPSLQQATHQVVSVVTVPFQLFPIAGKCNVLPTNFSVRSQPLARQMNAVCCKSF